MPTPDCSLAGARAAPAEPVARWLRLRRLLPLRELVNALSIPERVPQIELAIGEGADALVVRILQPLVAEDERLLREFADRYQVQFFLQPRGPASVTGGWCGGESACTPETVPPTSRDPSRRVMPGQQWCSTGYDLLRPTAPARCTAP